MHDGFLKNIGKCWPILDLKSNLNSLCELDSTGCKVFVERKSMRILRDALVVLKARKVKNFYVMLGNTIRGGEVFSTSYFDLVCT